MYPAGHGRVLQCEDPELGSTGPWHQTSWRSTASPVKGDGEGESENDCRSLFTNRTFKTAVNAVFLALAVANGKPLCPYFNRVKTFQKNIFERGENLKCRAFQ